MSYTRLAPVRLQGRWSGGRPGLPSDRLRRPLLQRAFARGSALRRMDWVLVLAVLALSVIGTLLVWSASPGSFVKQIINLVIGLAVLFGVSLLDYRHLRLIAPVLYIVSLLGLIAALTPLGTPVNGSKSWITLPAGYQIEPSEYAKLALVIVAATLLSHVRNAETRPGLRAAGLTIACALPPLLLVVKEPDLGVTVVMLLVMVGLIALSGLRLRWLAGMGVVAVAGVWAALGLHLLHAYQTSRITSFFNPSADPQGSGYNAHQAKLAIGSGGLFGQGLFHGQLVHGSFIPEQNTDFIFAVAGEELGFIGSVVIIGLIALLLVRALRIAARADDQFGMLIASGIVIWFAVQTFVNVGMTLGIMPVTGLPLPFVSYGGSALFADMIAVGVLQTVNRHHRVFG